MNYKDKYLKYKSKYLQLKEQIGSAKYTDISKDNIMMILEKLKPKQVIKYCLITNKKLCQNIEWPYLLKKKFPNDFKLDDDIIKKYKWLEDKKDPNIYQNKDSKYLFTIFAFGKKDELKKKAFKCFYYWAKGWSRVLLPPPSSHTIFSVMKLNETTIVIGYYDGILRIWDLTNDTSRDLRGHTEPVVSVIKLNETTIASGGYDGILRIWDLSATENSFRALGGTEEYNPIFSVMKLNETTIVSGSTDGILRIWDLINNTSREIFFGGLINSVIKLNETTIVAGKGDRTLEVLDLSATENSSRVLRGHTDSVQSVVKLNETTVVSGSYDNTLRVWDLPNDTSRALKGHTDDVNSVIKLNETTIVSGGYDNTLRVWDLTNDTSRVLRGHTNNVFSVIKLNETTIVSGSHDNTLRIWYGYF